MPEDDPKVINLKAGRPGEQMRKGQPRLVYEVNPGGGKGSGKGSGGARIPTFRPTDEHRQLVAILAANGVSEKVMSQAIGCGLNTIRKYFAKEIAEGFELVSAHVGAAVVRQALDGNISAARYWLATHAGPEWRMPKHMTRGGDDDERDDDDVVHFYMPPNGRDKPEPDELPPTIEGEAIEPVPEKTGTDDA